MDLENLITMENIKFSPSLKRLMRIYLHTCYEENADTSNESMLAEYEYLKKSGLLHQLFENEIMNNIIRLNGLGINTNKAKED